MLITRIDYNSSGICRTSQGIGSEDSSTIRVEGCRIGNVRTELKGGQQQWLENKKDPSIKDRRGVGCSILSISQYCPAAGVIFLYQIYFHVKCQGNF